jgi:uncharacterized protein with FMN-binding domain
MPNASRRPADHDRTPSRIPRRGAAALLATTAGIALLLSFRTPDAVATLGVGGIKLGSLGGTTADIGTGALQPRAVAVADAPVATDTPAATDPPATDPAATDPVATDTAPTPTPDPTRTPKPTASTQVIDGKVVNTRYGPVQVEITVKNGKLTDVQALQLPYDRQYSAEISQYVEPYLRREALQAQSANIDLISGATYTSDGYARSLQSAIKQVN